MPKRDRGLNEPTAEPKIVGKCDGRVAVAKLLPPDPDGLFAHPLDVVEWPASVRARRRTAAASLLSFPRAPR